MDDKKIFRFSKYVLKKSKRRNGSEKIDKSQFLSAVKQNTRISTGNIIQTRKHNLKIKYKQLLTRTVPLILAVYVLFFKHPSLALYGHKPYINPIPSDGTTVGEVSFQKQLSKTVNNILCVMKSYPNQFDNIGIVEANVIAFKYHLSNFIENQFGIRSEKIINNMVTSSENLYRFLADKKNHLGIKQHRTLKNISEKDLYHIKKNNNILINHFRKYKTYNISPYLSDENPELTVASATLYCFASDDDLKNFDSFIESIFIKSNTNYFNKGLFIKNIKNILNVNPSTTVEVNTVQKYPTAEKRIKKKIIRAAVVTDDKTNIKEIIKYFYTVAKGQKIEMQPLSIDELSTYEANKICLDDYPNMEFDIKFNVVAGSDLNKKLNPGSLHSKLIANDYYDVIIFAFDKNKYSGKHKSILKNRINKLKNFAPRQPIIFVSDKSNQSIYKDICNTIITGNH